MVKDWVFHFCRNSLRLPLGSFVRKIHFDGLDKIPKDTPILFAGNHPNSFLDGVGLSAYEWRNNIYPNTRGCLFKTISELYF